MNARIVLGLDIGGANLKAATADGRAVSVPFPLWKQPDALPAALAALVAQFPDATDLAVTMTGELCDCFETKRHGVNAILDATEHAAAGRPISVWGTDGVFHTVAEARANHLTVAAANWHALATFAGRYAPTGGGLLLDIGSTTCDLIPLRDGKPWTYGRTDAERLRHKELVYLGVRRTPVFAACTDNVCAELFATTADVFVVLGLMPEDATDTDTANGRPLTHGHSQTRLARVLGADMEEITADAARGFAAKVYNEMSRRIAAALQWMSIPQFDAVPLQIVVVSGAGEFLARRVIDETYVADHRPALVSLNDELGPVVSACAPAYAVAVLAESAVFRLGAS